jgi:hypothetical protein
MLYVFFFFEDLLADDVSMGVGGRESCLSDLWTSSIPRFCWKLLLYPQLIPFPEDTYLALCGL